MGLMKTLHPEKTTLALLLLLNVAVLLYGTQSYFIDIS